ncbi:hypothetical protein ARMSODRAFT_80994 [Armillaria solidipes]|uniref:Secreted protein n=1 Tax=Armillaria solidipes TaxID=1076256 RepID=A0A2H3AJ88_9AGAR|nr:hypothetical protein ARMSODRAFT_80994 [Armillaria solidipes]
MPRFFVLLWPCSTWESVALDVGSATTSVCRLRDAHIWRVWYSKHQHVPKTKSLHSLTLLLRHEHQLDSQRSTVFSGNCSSTSTGLVRMQRTLNALAVMRNLSKVKKPWMVSFLSLSSGDPLLSAVCPRIACL